MVASTIVEPTVQPQDEVDLNDEQIQQLLLEAEGRLRGSDAPSKELDIASLRYDDLRMPSAMTHPTNIFYQDPQIVSWILIGAVRPPE